MSVRLLPFRCFALHSGAVNSPFHLHVGVFLSCLVSVHSFFPLPLELSTSLPRVHFAISVLLVPFKHSMKRGVGEVKQEKVKAEQHFAGVVKSQASYSDVRLTNALSTAGHALRLAITEFQAAEACLGQTLAKAEAKNAELEATVASLEATEGSAVARFSEEKAKNAELVANVDRMTKAEANAIARLTELNAEHLQLVALTKAGERKCESVASAHRIELEAVAHRLAEVEAGAAVQGAALVKVTAELAEATKRLSSAEAYAVKLSSSLTRYREAAQSAVSVHVEAAEVQPGAGDAVELPALKDILQGLPAKDVDFRGSVRSLLAAAGSRNASGGAAGQFKREKVADMKGRLMFEIKTALRFASQQHEAFAETNTTFYIQLFVAAGFTRDRVIAEAGGYPASFTYLELQKLHRFMQTAGISF